MGLVGGETVRKEAAGSLLPDLWDERLCMQAVLASECMHD